MVIHRKHMVRNDGWPEDVRIEAPLTRIEILLDGKCFRRLKFAEMRAVEMICHRRNIALASTGAVGLLRFDFKHAAAINERQRRLEVGLVEAVVTAAVAAGHAMRYRILEHPSEGLPERSEEHTSELQSL